MGAPGHTASASPPMRPAVPTAVVPAPTLEECRQPVAGQPHAVMRSRARARVASQEGRHRDLQFIPPLYADRRAARCRRCGRLHGSAEKCTAADTASRARTCPDASAPALRPFTRRNLPAGKWRMVRAWTRTPTMPRAGRCTRDHGDGDEPRDRPKRRCDDPGSRTVREGRIIDLSQRPRARSGSIDKTASPRSSWCRSRCRCPTAASSRVPRRRRDPVTLGGSGAPTSALRQSPHQAHHFDQRPNVIGNLSLDQARPVLRSAASNWP